MLSGLLSWPWLAALGLAVAVAVSLAVFRRRAGGELPGLPTFGLSVLQRYVLRETIGPIFLSAITLTFFLLAQRLYKLVDLIISDASSGGIWRILLAILPTILSLTIPIAILLGVLLGVGRMAVDNEIRACQTAGVNVARVFWPLFLFCGLLSLAIMYGNFEYTPRMLRQGERIKAQLAYEALSSLPAGIPTEVPSEEGEIVFYYRDRDPDSGDLRNVVLLIEHERLEVDDAPPPDSGRSETQTAAAPIRPPAPGAWAAESSPPADAESSPQQTSPRFKKIRDHLLILASSGRIKADLENQSVVIRLLDGSFHDLGEDLDGEVLAEQIEEETVARAWGGELPASEPLELGREVVNRFDVMDYPISVKSDQDDQYKAKVSTLNEMLDRIRLGREFPPWRVEKESEILEKKRKYWAEIAVRAAVPLACVAFALLGVPLAIFVRPTGKSVGVALTFSLILIYYWMIKWGSSMAVDGHDIGFVVIFAPNVAMGGLGLIMFRRAIRL